MTTIERERKVIHYPHGKTKRTTSATAAAMETTANRNYNIIINSSMERKSKNDNDSVVVDTGTCSGTGQYPPPLDGTTDKF